jgi:hypothetical protein
LKGLRSALLSSSATGALPTRAPHQAPVIARFYYSETFEHLIRSNAPEIQRRLIDLPLAFRARQLAPAFMGAEDLEPETTWALLRAYLDTIEARIAEIAARHSPAYWFHLYRRIAPMLSSKHVGKRDATTVVLVRQIAELAYLKHGNQATTADLGAIGRTTFDTFLGGHYKTAMVWALGSLANARQHYAGQKATSQSVMLDFDDEDLFSAFEVEGLAYEYWKASAAMRSLGKGVGFDWDEETHWLTDRGDGPHPVLFANFDHRITGATGLFTRFGTWTQFARGKADFSTAYLTTYNPNGTIEQFPTWDAANRQIVYGQSRLNFHIGQMQLQTFLEDHTFMAKVFEKRHKVKLEAVLFCLQIASFFAFFPDRAIFEKDPDRQKSMILNNLTNLGFRGYKNIGQTIDTIAQEALWWAKQMRHEIGLDVAQVRAGFEFLLLTETTAIFIGLWSGGKRPLLIPFHDGLMIDTTAIVPILVNLFVGVRETTGSKGDVFEAGARAVLRAAGLDIVFNGEIIFHDGSVREIDAAVRIGNRLVLVECFSFEKPLDYELAKPGIFQSRIGRIGEKITQAQTLAEAITRNPMGTNFDFSWADSIEWRLATPSVEFAWKLSDDQFDAMGVPRVLQISELSSYLLDGTNPIAPFCPVLHALRDA